MKQAIAIILLLSSLCSASALSIKDFYISYQTEIGSVFFVKPQKLKLISHSGPKAGKEISFDFTYAQPSDSVRVLASLTLPSVSQITTLTIKDRKFPINLIYSSPDKSNFKYRLESYIPYSLWCEICDSENPFTLTYTDSNSQSWTFGFSEKEWNKRGPLFRQLIQIIKLHQSYE